MVSYKKSFYALSVMFTLFNFTIKSADLGELQARKYISHLIDSLFIPHNHPVSYQHHLNTFSQELTNNIIRNFGAYPHFYSYSKKYNDQQIYQEVVKESFTFIEKNARNLAINSIQQYNAETTNNQKKFVDKVVNGLMRELKNRFNKNALLPDGIFSTYFGNILEEKIQTQIDKEFKKEAARLERLNARIKCSNCSQNFNSLTHKKISLHCGHTLCLTCLKVLWYKMRTTIACIQCNTKINMGEHVPGIWVTPSAQDYGYYGNNQLNE